MDLLSVCKTQCVNFAPITSPLFVSIKPQLQFIRVRNCFVGLLNSFFLKVNYALEIAENVLHSQNCAASDKISYNHTK